MRYPIAFIGITDGPKPLPSTPIRWVSSRNLVPKKWRWRARPRVRVRAEFPKRDYHTRKSRSPEEQARIFALLKAHLAEYDRVLVGWTAIIDFCFKLGLTNGRKQRIKVQTLRSWARHQGLPILPGAQRGTANYSTLTSQHCIVAWVMSRMANGYPMRAFKYLDAR